ncbi:UbiA prenyltransferase family-domain-containing protein [Rhypophila decipiens]|uniref:UbiA prenyltransferase family-domain-containing protein n=1 Tax=Rhypophila decipiens TaxID=261697 RepID=A0AAN6Y2V8_9PEZI|nr:UbiA prenyltransferase family-domain-containing protein [Rhypophila decipiens]
MGTATKKTDPHVLPSKSKPPNSDLTNKDSNTTTESKNPNLAQQYGGIHTGSWVSHLPAHWVPYIQLSRLSPPVAISLIYFPHLFGALHAAILLNSTPLALLKTSLSLLLGTIFFSNAAHAWNDLIDSPIDALTSRTKTRPIPRGAITPRAAFLFACSQAVGAAAVLVLLTPRWESTVYYAVPNIMATMYYPFAKRHSHFVQVVLGVCLGWGVLMGASAMGVNPVSINAFPAPYYPAAATTTTGFKFTTWGVGGVDVEVTVVPSVLWLFLASATWSVLYDTIYAHQDLQDDVKNGVKSLAVLFRGATKYLLWGLLCIMGTALVSSGVAGGFSRWSGVIAAGGSSLALGGMIWGVDLTDSGSCWWWFKSGYWLTGLSITSALMGEYFFA